MLDEMPQTVLIVDDHAGYRSAARAVLEADGYEVIGESPTGQDALEQVERLRPELVLVDIGLPDIDGIEVARRLTSGADSPVVVLTSSRDGCGCERLFSGCGALGFIPKAELCGDTIAALA
jgi:DNA-binding NarL/FixJ family response regulator